MHKLAHMLAKKYVFASLLIITIVAGAVSVTRASEALPEVDEELILSLLEQAEAGSEIPKVIAIVDPEKPGMLYLLGIDPPPLSKEAEGTSPFELADILLQRFRPDLYYGNEIIKGVADAVWPILKESALFLWDGVNVLGYGISQASAGGYHSKLGIEPASGLIQSFLDKGVGVTLYAMPGHLLDCLAADLFSGNVRATTRSIATVGLMAYPLSASATTLKTVSITHAGQAAALLGLDGAAAMEPSLAYAAAVVQASAATATAAAEVSAIAMMSASGAPAAAAAEGQGGGSEPVVEEVSIVGEITGGKIQCQSPHFDIRINGSERSAHFVSRGVQSGQKGRYLLKRTQNANGVIVEQVIIEDRLLRVTSIHPDQASSYPLYSFREASGLAEKASWVRVSTSNHLETLFSLYDKAYLQRIRAAAESMKTQHLLSFDIF